MLEFIIINKHSVSSFLKVFSLTPLLSTWSLEIVITEIYENFY